MDAMTCLTTRRSVRKYAAQPVSRDLLEKIVDAGRLAPTARNVQPWEFVVITEPAKRRRVAEISEFGKFIADAAACIVVLSQPTKYYIEDGAAATTNMLNAATAQGLGSCWVAGDKKPYAAQIVAECGAPSDMLLVAILAIGYAAETPSPRKRSLADVIHWEQY